MMNILLALRQPLVPADTGGKVRSLNIVSRLAKRVSIHAISFADAALDAVSISQMRDLFDGYTPVFWCEKKKYSAGFYGEVLASQLGSWPYSLSKCNQPEFLATAQSLMACRRFDLVFCDFLHTAAPLLGLAVGPKVVFEHNVEFLLRKRRWEFERNALRRWVLGNEWRKTRTIEASVCRRFDQVLAVSDDDRETMRREFGVRNVSVLPTGVDTDFFRPAGGVSPPRPGQLVFVGSMDWGPNEDGVIWFLRDIYPRIRQVMPRTSFTIVGRSPSSGLRSLAAATADVEVTGSVPDVRPYLARAEIAVVPLRVGGGTRIKIPEAMAMRKPVVSTTIGAEGLPFRAGRELCLADEPDDFAETVLTLLRDEPLRTAIGAAARKTVVEKHGWDAVVDKVEAVLDQVISRAACGAGPEHGRSPFVQTTGISA
jgi:glycosyltransferase involved in cell wall biosynthesis